jgi:hypothetical protein
MRYRDKTVRSLVDLLDALREHKQKDSPVWFRGQAKASWKLKPSLVRKPSHLGSEQALAKRFKQNAYLLLSDRPRNEWEWLFVMQHHEVPTRLLDWTESPLVGIYFAVNERRRSPGALWSLLPVELNHFANVPAAGPFDIPAVDEDAFLANYSPSALASEQQTKLKTVSLLAPRNTTRSQAQHAVFTITHRDLTSIERVGDHRHV